MGLRQGFCAQKSVFLSVLMGFASKSVAFSTKLHYWTLWLFRALCSGWDRLNRPTLIHGIGHGKGRLKLS